MAETTQFSSLASALADRYHLVRPVGAGGMATVYLAEDVRHDRKVAITVLRSELAAVIGGDRFLTEIRTTAITGVASWIWTEPPSGISIPGGS